MRLVTSVSHNHFKVGVDFICWLVLRHEYDLYVFILSCCWEWSNWKGLGSAWWKWTGLVESCIIRYRLIPSEGY